MNEDKGFIATLYDAGVMTMFVMLEVWALVVDLFFYPFYVALERYERRERVKIMKDYELHPDYINDD